MTQAGLSISLEGISLGFSGAVPERKYWTEIAQDRGILEFVALLSGLVLKYGGRVIHGAHPTFTPVILRQAELHGKKTRSLPVTICMSNLWAKSLKEHERERYKRESEFVVVPQVGDGEPGDQVVRNASLTAMRRVLISKMNVLVAVGGLRHESTGFAPGVTEELELAQLRRIPCFVLGGLGGEAGQMAAQLKHKLELLNNGLPPSSNLELLTTKDISASVGIIFNHLVQSRDVLLRSIDDNLAL